MKKPTHRASGSRGKCGAHGTTLATNSREQPVDLPAPQNSEWRTARFDAFATLQRGFDLPNSSRNEGAIPVVGSVGIVGRHDSARVRGPGVVTGRSGSIGQTIYIGSDFWPLNTALYVRDFHGNSPRFVQYFLQWFDLARFKSGVSVPTLNRNSVNGSEVIIPPVSEQRRIAAVLWKLQRAIATQDRLIAATRDLKQSAMQRLFTHGLRGDPLKDTEIGLLPESWTLICLGDAYETQLGKMLSQKARVGDQPKPYVRNKNVQWGRLDLSDLLVMDFDEREATKFRLAPGDLLVCEGGVIGRAAIWRGELGECYFQKALHRIRPKDDSTSNEFLCYWLSFSFEQQNLYNIGGASSTIAHLPQILLAGLKIPLPAIDEQRDIAAALATIDRKLAHHQRKRATLNDLFQAVLHLLMTAQVRVTDLDIDTSEVTASAPNGEPA